MSFSSSVHHAHQFSIGLVVICLTMAFSAVTAWAADQVPPQPVESLHLDSGAEGKPIPNLTPHASDSIGTAPCAEDSYPFRGILISGDHGSDVIHHDNAYIQIEGGPVLYQGSIPAFRAGNVLPDPGLLWHFFTRDDSSYTIYATSSYENGLESDLSEPFPLSFCYPTNGCSEQTVPVAIAGPDQVVAADTPVTLDAGASYDPYPEDTAGLQYRWECFSAPETVALSDAGQAAQVSFTPATVGRYYFRLNVRDMLDGSQLNRSAVDYVRVSVVSNPNDGNLVEADAGRTQQAQVGDLVTLDGSHTVAPGGATYQWVQSNPTGDAELAALANVLGTSGCQGTCYKANFDADGDVDGADIALLANNYGPIELAGDAVVDFIPALPRPHIFRLTVAANGQSSSESTIVGVYHPNAAEVMTPPPVDSECSSPLPQ
jgi:K319L-like, PKD domain